MVLLRHVVAPMSLAVCGCVQVALGQGSITEIPRLSGAEFQSVQSASADGDTVIGSALVSGSLRAFRWTAQGGTQPIGSLASGGHTIANGVSADGRVIVGVSAGRAFRWTSLSGMQGLLDSGNGAGAEATSGDGWRTVGLMNDPTGMPSHVAVDWWSPGQPPGLIMDSFTHNRASAISRDGEVVFGSSFEADHGVLWRDVRGDIRIVSPSMTGGIPQVRQCSADGALMVGNFAGGSQPSYAFLWSEAALQPLTPLSGYATASVFGINATGGLIVGASTVDPQSPSVACMWDSTQSPIALNTYLSARGVDLGGWTLTSCSAVSDDGTVFVGNGTYNGLSASWRATIPVPSGLAVLSAGGFMLARRRRGVLCVPAGGLADWCER